MGLNIEDMNETQLTGTLDGMLPVEVRREGNLFQARIAGFQCRLEESMCTGIAAMRYAVYAAIARYRAQMKEFRQ